jgi:hypothetical protein
VLGSLGASSESSHRRDEATVRLGLISLEGCVRSRQSSSPNHQGGQAPPDIKVEPPREDLDGTDGNLGGPWTMRQMWASLT